LPQNLSINDVHGFGFFLSEPGRGGEGWTRLIFERAQWSQKCSKGETIQFFCVQSFHKFLSFLFEINLYFPQRVTHSNADGTRSFTK